MNGTELAYMFLRSEFGAFQFGNKVEDISFEDFIREVYLSHVVKRQGQTAKEI